jgi:hypothetical protein
MEQEQKPAAPPAIRVNKETQAIIVQDNAELMRLIQTMMKGQAFPKTLDTPERAIAAWQMAASLRLPPAVAIQNMAVINGSVTLWGQLPKALAEATGELEDFRLIYIDENQDRICLENKNLNKETWGAVVQIKRRGRTMNEYVFTMDDAKKAGLKGKQGPWTLYTKIMLSRRATAQAIKFEFPDAVMGLKIAEYDLDEAPDLKDVTPAAVRNQNVADEFWRELQNGKSDAAAEVEADQESKGD